MNENNLSWTCTKGRTNGVDHEFYVAKFRDILINILWATDTKGVILGINGYLFSYDTVDLAKEDAVNRIINNRGIYLQTY